MELVCGRYIKLSPLFVHSPTHSQLRDTEVCNVVHVSAPEVKQASAVSYNTQKPAPTVSGVTLSSSPDIFRTKLHHRVKRGQTESLSTASTRLCKGFNWPVTTNSGCFSLPQST